MLLRKARKRREYAVRMGIIFVVARAAVKRDKFDYEFWVGKKRSGQLCIFFFPIVKIYCGTMVDIGSCFLCWDCLFPPFLRVSDLLH